jgi:two-component system sensor histidine kinase UhpB
VWFSIALGLIVLMLFLGVLAFAGARASQRRRRQTEMLLSDLLEARESERRRIVGALHGDVGQPLYRLLYGIEGSRAKIDQPEVIDEELQRLSELVRDIDAILRAELRLLHRAEIADVGLGPAIAELVETTRTEAGLDIELSYEVEGTVDNVPGSALLWACEEGLFNVRKHADASRVTVRVWRSGATLSVEVVDDGVGVDGPEGLGLRTTRERLSAIGGGLDVRRQRGGGTRFGAWVPATSEASR